MNVEGLPKFNKRSDAPKRHDEPGEGDDVPCVKCGGALDTGLECSECGHDNYESVTGKAFCSASATKQRASHDEDQLQMAASIYSACISSDGAPYVDGPGDGFGYEAKSLRLNMHFSTESDAKAAAKCSNEAYHQGFMAAQQAIREALGHDHNTGD